MRHEENPRLRTFSDAGGGTRTPDTRIMIGGRIGAFAVPEGL
jgi:hypothetical protein